MEGQGRENLAICVSETSGIFRDERGKKDKVGSINMKNKKKDYRDIHLFFGLTTFVDNL